MPTPLDRLFGRGRPRKGDDAAFGLRLAAALLDSPRPVRVFEAACRLALRTRGCDLALVVTLRRDGDQLVVEPLAGQAPGRRWRDLREALQCRQSPLRDLSPGSLRWLQLGDDQFQPGAATLRRLDLRWFQALSLNLGEGPDEAAVLLAGRQDELDEHHTLVRISRLVWHIVRDRLASDGSPAANHRTDWSVTDTWDAVPVALARVSPSGVESVNREARQVLTNNVGRDGAAWETWLQGAVQRLLSAGKTAERMTASRSRDRELDVRLSDPLDAEQHRMVVLAEAGGTSSGSVADQESVLRTLGHELRTPLAAMKTSLNLVLSGGTGELSADQTRFLGATSRNVDRLNRLLNDLLDAQRADAGLLSVNTAAVDLGEVLHQDLTLLGVSAAEKGLTLDVDDVPTAFGATVDADKVQQILHNVVSNAVKYTPRGGLVKVALLGSTWQAPGLGVRLARQLDLPCEAFTVLVEDSGMGMSEDYLQRLFEPFRRDDRAEASRLPGAGLGLHITRGLAEAHGGEIRLNSQPGRGTTVWVVLPREPESAHLITVGRRLAAMRTRYPALQPVCLDLRGQLDNLEPWQLEAAGDFSLRFLDILRRRHHEDEQPAEVGWALSNGLWLGLVRDTERLAAAWEVATAAPGTPAAVAAATWQTLVLDEATAAPSSETTDDSEANEPTAAG